MGEARINAAMSPAEPFPRPGQSPVIRFTGMLAGTYRYIDFPGAEPQLVDVTYEDGHAVVRFVDLDPEDQQEQLLASDMAGTFERAAP